MGLDRVGRVALLLAVALLVGCDSQAPPKRLMYGEPAAEFKPVRNSVVSIGRILRGTTLGRRFLTCKPDDVARDARVVERIGVFGERLTFTDRRHKNVFACDGGSDPAGEHRPPWCSGSAGRLFEGRLLDPRLDVGCRDRTGRALAYAWVEPVVGSHWIGVDQGSYTELYEVLGRVPVRIASTRGVDLHRSRATFGVTQYDVQGHELVKVDLEAAVAG